MMWGNGCSQMLFVQSLWSMNLGCPIKIKIAQV